LKGQEAREQGGCGKAAAPLLRKGDELEKYPAQTVLRRTSEEVRWHLLTAPDVGQVTHELSHRLRRQIENEAQQLIGSARGPGGHLGPIGVRTTQRVNRPWFTLGLAVRCRVEAAAKVRVLWDEVAETAVGQSG
jgi:hypothetical protein